jgi:hypothetical protein
MSDPRFTGADRNQSKNRSGVKRFQLRREVSVQGARASWLAKAATVFE